MSVVRCAKTKRGVQCKKPAGHWGLCVFRTLKVQGAKAERERDDLDRLRDAVKLRSRGYCEARFSERCTGVGTEVHHIHPSDRDRGVHDPRRAVWACRWCHRDIHAQPLKARAKGLLRQSWEQAS